MRSTQTPPRKTLKAVGFTVFSWAFLLMSVYFLLTGLYSGRVWLLGHIKGGIVYRATEPGMYWFGEAVWSFYILIGAFTSEAFLRWQQKLRDAWGRRVQVRSAEAGEGPEPPWVRFPGRMGTLDDPTPTGHEAMSYFDRVFLPYWARLSPEACRAYLRRHPPPDDWRTALEDLKPLA